MLSLLLPSSPSLCLPAVGALYLCLSPFFFSLLLSLTILPPLVAPRLTSVCLLGRPLHLTIPYSPSCSPCFCPDPSCSISFSSTYSTFYSLFAFIPTPSFVFTPSFFTSSSFPCFYFFSFHGSGNDGSQRQNTNTRARVLVNSSYDMQMRVKILTVYLTHIITRLNARAGATAAVWACACLPVNCVPRTQCINEKKKQQPHLLLSSWI